MQCSSCTRRMCCNRMLRWRAFSRLTRSGARVVSTGLKLFPWYIGIANVWLLAISYPYFTTFKGLAKPWAPLERYVDLLGVRSTFFGSGYIAEGVRR